MESQNQINTENLKISKYMEGVVKVIPTATKTKTIITFQHPGRSHENGKSVYLLEDLHYHDFEEQIWPVISKISTEYGVVIILNNKKEAGIFNRIAFHNPINGKFLMEHERPADYPVAEWLWEAVVELLENPWLD